MASTIPDPDDGFDWTAAEAEVFDLDDARNKRSKPAGKPADTGSDAHFGVDLDDVPARGGGPVDAPTVAPNGYRPIVPSQLSNWANIKSTARHAAAEAGHRVGYHAVRTPIYTVLAAFGP
jgi:DNA segregation ATPase FtsK/SpoIIIE, S-DNA-T family